VLATVKSPLLNEPSSLRATASFRLCPPPLPILQRFRSGLRFDAPAKMERTIVSLIDTPSGAPTDQSFLPRLRRTERALSLIATARRGPRSTDTANQRDARLILVHLGLGTPPPTQGGTRKTIAARAQARVYSRSIFFLLVLLLFLPRGVQRGLAARVQR